MHAIISIRKTLLFVFGLSLFGIGLFSPCHAESPDVPATEPSVASWLRFRGTNGQGVLSDCEVKLPWAESQVQRIVLPGTGNGSPMLSNGVVFLLSANSTGTTRDVIAVELASNKIKWTKTYASNPHPLHKYSSYASSTPCGDGKNIYVAWADPENLICKALSEDGEEIWSRSFGRYVSQHGFGTSPILVNGNVVLLNSQDALELPAGVEPGQDRMIALNCVTGETAWEKELPTSRVCYGVPCVRETKNGTELLCSTTEAGMFAMDPTNGNILWSHQCFKQRVCSSSLLVGDLLIGSHGSGAGKDNKLVAWDMVKQKERFTVKRAAPYVPTSVALDGLLFLWSDSGIVSCVDLLNGDILWSKRIGGDFSGSPVIIDRKLINASHDGVVTVLSAEREFGNLGSIETGQTIRSTIAADTRHLLLRTNSELWIVR